MRCPSARYDSEVLLHVLQKPRHDSAKDATTPSYPDWLRTNARVHMRNFDGSSSLAHIEVDTQGRMPGVDEEQFRIYSAEAEPNRPVSPALAGIPEIVLTAKLV
jgi:organic hydroperoxide reductase OsmC/OhrA